MQSEVEAVFTRWKSTMGHPRARLDPKRAKAIRGMLAVGYSVDDLELAIFGCSICPFHQGKNDRLQRFDDIGLICRDAEHIDKFIAIAEQAASRKTAQALEKPRQRLMDKPATSIPAHVLAMVRK